MFIRWIFPGLLIVAILTGLLTGFAKEFGQLDPYFNEAPRVLSEQSTQVNEFDGQTKEAIETYTSINQTTVKSTEELIDIRAILTELADNARRESELDQAQKKAVDGVVAESKQHSQETGDALDSVLSTILGKPIGQTFGKRANVKVFSLQEAGLRGYMAKVKLHDAGAVKMVLSGDQVGDKGETTSAAAKRTEAVLAINAGGFARKDGLLYPMGITVIDGEIKTFYSTEFSFIGFNKDGKLVGGDITTKEQIEDMNIMHGASFLPTLLKDGEKLTIPSKYAKKKEPRTMIGHFSNGDLLFIVIDGRSKSSSGVTLEEAQDKLLEWNVRDAYNLDGGGSSSFVYKGKVLNSPSDGSERRVVSNLVVLP